MKLAVISMRPKIGDKKSNLQKMENYIKKTKADMYNLELAWIPSPITDRTDAAWLGTSGTRC